MENGTIARLGEHVCIPPAQMTDIAFAFAQSDPLWIAVKLDLFTWVARGVDTPARLAFLVPLSEAALSRLFGALCALRFLRCTASGYALTPISERYLVADRSHYLGDLMLELRCKVRLWESDGALSLCSLEKLLLETPLSDLALDPLFLLMYPVARCIMDRLGVGRSRHAQWIADLGSGVGAIAALELDAQAHGVAFDFAEALFQAQRSAQEYGVSARLECCATDLAALELPGEAFDLIFAGHLARMPEGAQALIWQCYQALKPGACMVVLESYRESVQDLFAVSQPSCTSQRLYQWLKEAGFRVEIWTDITAEAVLIATRPAWVAH